MRTSVAIIFCVCLLSSPAFADKVRILETTADAAQVRIDLIQQAKHSIDAQYHIVGNDFKISASSTVERPPSKYPISRLLAGGSDSTRAAWRN